MHAIGSRQYSFRLCCMPGGIRYMIIIWKKLSMSDSLAEISCGEKDSEYFRSGYVVVKLIERRIGTHIILEDHLGLTTRQTLA